MVTQISDTDIRGDVRSHLARHRIDMQRIQLRVFNGTVRMCGEVYYLGAQKQPVPINVIESFERDVASTRGVQYAFFEFDNWRRLSTGEWEAVEHGRPETEAGGEEAERQPVLERAPMAGTFLTSSASR